MTISLLGWLSLASAGPWTRAELGTLVEQQGSVELPKGQSVALTHRFPRTFLETGELVATLEVRGDVSEGWRVARLAQYGPSGLVSVAETEWGQLSTEGWSTHTLRAPLHPAAEEVFIELHNGMAGLATRAWTLSLDRVPVVELAAGRVPAVAGPRPVSSGTGVGTRVITNEEARSIRKLVRVWGFLKYRHPLLLAGRVDFDGLLFDALVALQAGESADAILDGWQKRLPAPTDGEVLTLSPYSLGEVGTAWLAQVEEPYGQWLRDVHTHRATLENGVPAQTNGNWTTFPNESSYRDGDTGTDAGLRMLGLARYWTVLMDFNAYNDLLADWGEAIDDLVPVMLSPTTDQAAYELAMHTLAARARDGHAQFFNNFDTLTPVGECRVAAGFRIIDGVPVVVSSTVASLKVGDELLELGDVDFATVVPQWAQVHPGATDAGKRASLELRVSHGACGPVAGVVRRAGKTRKVKLERVEGLGVDDTRSGLPGDAIQMRDGVAYVRLGGVDDVEAMIRAVQGTKGIVLDTRDYPRMTFKALNPHLSRVPHRTNIGAHADPMQPGGLMWNPDSLALLQPKEPLYEGRVAVLIDVHSFSRGEAIALVLKALPGGVRTFGEPTSGTDGSKAEVAIPGMYAGSFTHNVILPLGGDHVQQRGLQPDVVVGWTAEDVAAGRDPVVEAAVGWVRDAAE